MALLLRMKEAMEKTLDEAWRKRAAGLPLANRREALMLASIIEKETAVPAERPPRWRRSTSTGCASR